MAKNQYFSHTNSILERTDTMVVIFKPNSHIFYEIFAVLYFSFIILSFLSLEFNISYLFGPTGLGLICLLKFSYYINNHNSLSMVAFDQLFNETSFYYFLIVVPEPSWIWGYFINLKWYLGQSTTGILSCVIHEWSNWSLE